MKNEVKDVFVSKYKKDTIGWVRYAYIDGKKTVHAPLDMDLAYAMILVAAYFDFGAIDVADWFKECIESIKAGEGLEEVSAIYLILFGDILTSRMVINHGYFRMLCMNHKAPTNYLTQGGKRNSKYGTANFWAGFETAAKHSEFISIARAAYNKFGPTDIPIVPESAFAANNTPQAIKVVLFCLGAI